MRKRVVNIAVVAAIIAGSSVAGAAAVPSTVPETRKPAMHGNADLVRQAGVESGGLARMSAGSATIDKGAVLASGQTMNGPTEYLSSASSQFEIAADGGLGEEVGLYWNAYSSLPVEMSGDPSGAGHLVLVMQGDGNLVLYTNTGSVVWATNTEGNPGAKAVLQNDGNFVVYSTAGRALWGSATFAREMFSYRVTGSEADEGMTFLAPGWFLANNGYTLVQQADGNLVLYSRNRVIWASNTEGNPGAVTVLQPDGNLVTYSTDGRALWANGRYRAEGIFLLSLEPDGNLVEVWGNLSGSQVRVLWETRTAGL